MQRIAVKVRENEYCINRCSSRSIEKYILKFESKMNTNMGNTGSRGFRRASYAGTFRKMLKKGTNRRIFVKFSSCQSRKSSAK